MSYLKQAEAGLADVTNRKWDSALDNLTKALQQSTNPAWLIARSKALVGLGRFEDSLEDANLAFHAACERNKRELIIEAHYRRAVAYNRLGQLANADCCATWSMGLIKGAKASEDTSKGLVDENGFWTATAAEAHKQARDDEFNQSPEQPSGLEAAVRIAKVQQWRMASHLRISALTKMDELPADDPARNLTAPHNPPKKQLAKLEQEPKKTDGKVAQAPTPATTAAPAASKTPAAPVAQRPRIEHFQSNQKITVSIFSKGNKKEDVNVMFKPNSVTLDPIFYPNKEQKEFSFNTFGQIEPGECTYTVTANKIELGLKKTVPGTWGKVESDSPAGVKTEEPT